MHKKKGERKKRASLSLSIHFVYLYLQRAKETPQPFLPLPLNQPLTKYLLQLRSLTLWLYLQVPPSTAYQELVPDRHRARRWSQAVRARSD